MAAIRQRVDKTTFKQIFRDPWEPFTQHQPRYRDRHVQAVIDQMLGWYSGGGLYHVSVPALPGGKAGGLQLQE